MIAEHTRRAGSIKGLATIRANRTKAAAKLWNKAHPNWIDLDNAPVSTKDSLNQFWKHHHAKCTMD